MSETTVAEPPTSPGALHPLKWVAKQLSVHETTVRDLIRGGELGAVRVGKRLLVSDEQLARFIRDHTIGPDGD